MSIQGVGLSNPSQQAGQAGNKGNDVSFQSAVKAYMKQHPGCTESQAKEAVKSKQGKETQQLPQSSSQSQSSSSGLTNQIPSGSIFG